MEDRKAVVVGISGASSSGKTTLARLLRDVFPATFILHEDDFYKPETELPMKDGLLDWDCDEAIDIPAMTRALSWIRSHGTFPPFVDSMQDQNSVGACPVSDAAIAAAKSKVAAWLAPGSAGHGILLQQQADGNEPDAGLRVCLLDGFLLYSPPMETGGVPAALDARLFLRVSRARAVERRGARDGYVTLEGFWTDPPGYVDRVVWPNYAAAHARLFRGGDVEGALDEHVLREMGIRAQTDRGADVDMETTFAWAVDLVMERLEEIAGRR
ncbi:P-loop containing nucleoside triphosphate hydrolase protein [Hypoxylon sp. FL1284]|nr:P-loop containing nucleoside triphosphate hydrolase protein [Hypoxylon sp. FL1284]